MRNLTMRARMEQLKKKRLEATDPAEIWAAGELLADERVRLRHAESKALLDQEELPTGPDRDDPER